ncbi:flavodoxin [Gottschalkia acidurici 9a]|uniref:Flavodoxin n=1 Tax=Gottschalkia acidurici (strain ATCC 7906 / DSM 604 / BCRC 14475 / CIP 104303 / KCTC 5404 / NCIMB 10678 / 9a) TaxID=1128398 RepID=K0B2Z0_GOTA9|nr:flavodoxin [Gottschalkia acidurici]AFS79537.1 flavodoxin [Gottschalkia acidurici 9a]
MKKVSIIYFSGTGNTEAMANAISEGVKEAGGSPEIIPVESASAENISGADVIALGCPSMGAEVLDDTMDMFVDSIEGEVSGKPVALFGSYDWGDGEWMRDWYERMNGYGANMIQDEGLICHLTPEDDDIEVCKALGKKLAN